MSNNAKANVGEIYIENNIIYIGLIDRPDQKECCKKLIDEIMLENKEKNILFQVNLVQQHLQSFSYQIYYQKIH